MTKGVEQQLSRIPSVRTAHRVRSSDEVEAIASRWRVEILEQVGDDRPVAGAVPSTPEAVPLLAALTSLPTPAILLPPDSRAWHTGLRLPAATRIALPPSLASHASLAGRLGYVPFLLSDPQQSARPRRDPPLTPLQSPGIVLFTSGSTGSPKPVFRPMNALLAGVRAFHQALELRPGDGILAGVSLAHGHGLNVFISSIVLGGPIGLLNPLDHRAAFAMLALPEFACWSATAHFADTLGRCPLPGPAIAPRVCRVTSPISRAVFDAFLRRFGVPLRQSYSSSETGIVATDTAPASAVDSGTVGRPLAGVDVRIGSHPDESSPPGENGRIWVRSPWQMAGYGFPPAVERPGDIDGWWPTRDLGRLDPDGRLVLAGRLDDCIRTREGRLVNLAVVAGSLRAAAGVRDVAVVPIQSSAGASFGAVLECDPSVTLANLKKRLSDQMPQWAWPRAMAIVPSLPRLPSGKLDRQSCCAMLGGLSL